MYVLKVTLVDILEQVFFIRLTGRLRVIDQHYEM